MQFLCSLEPTPKDDDMRLLDEPQVSAIPKKSTANEQHCCFSIITINGFKNKNHVWFGYIIYVPCQVGGTNQPTYVGVGDWQVESLQPKIVLGGLLAIFAQAGWCGVNQTSPTGGNWGCVAVSLDGEGNLLGNLLEVQAHFLQKGHPCGANVVDGCQVYLWGNVFVTLFKPNRPPPQGEE